MGKREAFNILMFFLEKKMFQGFLILSSFSKHVTVLKSIRSVEDRHTFSSELYWFLLTLTLFEHRGYEFT